MKIVSIAVMSRKRRKKDGNAKDVKLSNRGSLQELSSSVSHLFETLFYK